MLWVNVVSQKLIAFNCRLESTIWMEYMQYESYYINWIIENLFLHEACYKTLSDFQVWPKRQGNTRQEDIKAGHCKIGEISFCQISLSGQHIIKMDSGFLTRIMIIFLI